MLMLEFWKRFHSQMTALDLSKKEIAAKADVNYGTFIGLECRDRLPRLEEAVRIAKALEVSVEWLVTGDEPEFTKAMVEEVVDTIKSSKKSEDPLIKMCLENINLYALLRYYAGLSDERLIATCLSLGISISSEGKKGVTNL